MTFEIFVQLIGVLTSISVALGGAFHLTVIRPLQNTIDGLRADIAEMRKERLALIERVHILEITVAENKQSIRSAHHRIDEILETEHEKK